MVERSRDLDEDLDLDGGVERQHRYADGRARVHAGVTERRTEQVGGAVGDLRLAGEVGRRGHEADHLDDALDLVEVADLGLHGGDRVERALLGVRAASSGRHLAADLPGGQQLARAHRELAGGVDVGARPDRGHVGRDRLGHVGHGQPELGETVLDGAHQPATGRLK